MYFIGTCGAQIEMYGDPNNEVIVQCAMGRTMCCDKIPMPEELCDGCRICDAKISKDDSALQ